MSAGETQKEDNTPVTDKMPPNSDQPVDAEETLDTTKPDNDHNGRDLLLQIISPEIQSKLLENTALWTTEERGELDELSTQTAEQRDKLIDLLTHKSVADMAELNSSLKSLDMEELAEKLEKVASDKSDTPDSEIKDSETQNGLTEEYQNTKEEKEEKAEIIQEPPLSYKEVIRKTTGTLIDCLIVNVALLDHLKKTSVLSPETRNMILCRPNRPEQCKLLVDLLSNLGPKSLNEFVNALRLTNQTFLADILDSFTYV